MTTPFKPFLCIFCKHLDRKVEVPGDYRCTAFPEGILPDILSNTVDHREPIQGDGGIQYIFDAERFENRKPSYGEMFP